MDDYNGEDYGGNMADYEYFRESLVEPDENTLECDECGWRVLRGQDGIYYGDICEACQKGYME